MQLWHWMILLRPFEAFVFFVLVVAPIACLIRSALPEGKLKRFLTKDRTTPAAPMRDRVLYGLAVVGLYAALIAYAIWVSSRSWT
ncbi:MAG TPA: hypothetical protein VFB08_02170 [Burkholderiales bacterium]|nr:hypothetical protein [Burkholderiales bacterium]